MRHTAGSVPHLNNIIAKYTNFMNNGTRTMESDSPDSGMDGEHNGVRSVVEEICNAGGIFLWNGTIWQSLMNIYSVCGQHNWKSYKTC